MQHAPAIHCSTPTFRALRLMQTVCDSRFSWEVVELGRPSVSPMLLPILQCSCPIVDGSCGGKAHFVQLCWAPSSANATWQISRHLLQAARRFIPAIYHLAAAPRL